jgi:hypothetical protein
MLHQLLGLLCIVVLYDSQDSDGNNQQFVDNLVNNDLDFFFNDDYQSGQSSFGDHGPTSPSFGGSSHGSMLNEDEGNMSPCATDGQQHRVKFIGRKWEERFNQMFNLFAELLKRGFIPKNPKALTYNYTIYEWPVDMNSKYIIQHWKVGRWIHNLKSDLKNNPVRMMERARKFEEIDYPL